jgi:two-component system chemotaxis sensor kinase CheA
MDEELYQAFVTESEESITRLNNSLLALEATPDDDDAVDEIFRQAHTLKGNFGAMGFEDAATVAHAVEDLLDEVRNDRLDVTAERMDLAFDGMDEIQAILRDIEAHGESRTDPTATVERIRAAVDAGDPDAGGGGSRAGDEATRGDGDGAGDGDGGGGDGDGGGGDGTAPDGGRGGPESAAPSNEVLDPGAVAGATRVYRADVELDVGDGELKGVDAGIFLGGLPDELAVVGADPDLDAVERGEFDGGLSLFVADVPGDELAATLSGLWKVESVECTDVTDDLARGESAAEATSGGERPAAGDGATGADPAPPKKAARDRSVSAVKSVRVDVAQLDELHELVEQLVTSRIKLRQAMEVGGDAAAGTDSLDELDKVSSSLQNTVMDMRLIPLEKVFDKFPRLVRDLAREQEKRVRFAVEGEEIELDRTILDEISDPLMHVLRNAVDHGIETPEEREAAGKPPTGTIELRARRKHDTVIVTVEDDGGGIDADAVREKAVSKGLATREEMDALADEAVYDYVFHPGFSTNDEITDVSGRGVGMDVVKTTVESLDGSVDATSAPGEGSTFTIRLPVSVAIIRVLFVGVGDREFGVPIKYIDEISRRRRVETIEGAEVVVSDDRIFPLVRLRDALGVDAPERDAGMIVRIRPEDRRIALHCDRVTEQAEVVVTPLQGPLKGTRGLSGTAVIGDGNVIPILDVSTLELPGAGARASRERTPPSADRGGPAGADEGPTADDGSAEAEEVAD